jgi:diguanylate cyclase (GGDEF)-like protein
MSRQKIDHLRLLESVLPLERLPADVRAIVDDAIRSQDPGIHELAAKRAIDVLVAMGILRPVGRPEGGGPERYINRLTGDTIRVRWGGAAPTSVVKLPIPPDQAGDRLSIEAATRILAFDARVLPADVEGPAPLGEVIRAAITTATELTGADFVAFHLTRRRDPGSPGAMAYDVRESADDGAEPRIADLQPHLAPGERAVVYFPDLDLASSLKRFAPSPEFRSAAFAVLGEPGTSAPAAGVLEAWSRTRRFLTNERLLALGVLAQQVGESLRKVEILQRLVFYDAPTGLYNRSFFDRALETEMARARRAGHSLALAIADIDDFKTVNTRFGYSAGNEILVQVAQLLKRSVRPFDVAARWGGEEFGLILTEPVGELEALAICNRLRETVTSHPYTVMGLDQSEHTLTLSLSAGLAIFPDDAETAKLLWSRANAALQQAKREGKNRVMCAGRLGRAER